MVFRLVICDYSVTSHCHHEMVSGPEAAWGWQVEDTHVSGFLYVQPKQVAACCNLLVGRVPKND